MKQYEIEIKCKVSSPTLIRKKMKEFKAKKIRSGEEHNEFYDFSNKLKNKKIALRLRRCGDKSWLTLKGRRLTKRPVKRFEVETEIDYGFAKELMRTLGYSKRFSYSKHREEYKVKGAFITLDYLKKIGWFLEIEGSKSAIRQWFKKLSLKETDIEDRSYLEILFGNKL